MATIPSDETAKGPFIRVATPAKAVDRLARLYDEATQALRSSVERFLKTGEPPSAARRSLFRYPELRLIYEPSVPPPSTPRAYAKFTEPGVYAVTVTQPADFRGYLLEQLGPLVSEYGAHVEVGVGDQEIPYPYVIESGDELTRGAPMPLNSLATFPFRRWRPLATRPPTASSSTITSGRWRCSTRRGSIIPSGGWFTTPARTGGRCSPGCYLPIITVTSISSCSGA